MIQIQKSKELGWFTVHLNEAQQTVLQQFLWYAENGMSSSELHTLLEGYFEYSYEIDLISFEVEKGSHTYRPLDIAFWCILLLELPPRFRPEQLPQDWETTYNALLEGLLWTR